MKTWQNALDIRIARLDPQWRALLKGLLGVLLFVYPWGVVLISIDFVPSWGTWLGGAYLMLMGTMMGVWLVINYRGGGVLVSGLIMFGSWLVEHVGVVTGVPFGAYDYTNVLVPQIAGVVPLAIPFAWLLVVPASVGTARSLLRMGTADDSLPTAPARSLSEMLRVVLVAATLTTLLDLMIEPVVTRVTNYWAWDPGNGGGAYYGIPLVNFVAWWVTSALFAWVLVWLQWNGERNRRSPGADEEVAVGAPPGDRVLFFPWLPYLLYVLLLGMFVVINTSHTHLVAALIGGPVLAYLVFDWLRPYVVQRLRLPLSGGGME
ncbi:MAG: carotenoid biosynthesis protein [Chloroflexaceae bacterium]|nr:carotenoid biosynthesis protein [Chloroflexaceae bacterium]